MTVHINTFIHLSHRTTDGDNTDPPYIADMKTLTVVIHLKLRYYKALFVVQKTFYNMQSLLVLDMKPI